jgi:hypothetical protein
MNKLNDFYTKHGNISSSRLASFILNMIEIDRSVLTAEQASNLSECLARSPVRPFARSLVPFLSEFQHKTVKCALNLVILYCEFQRPDGERKHVFSSLTSDYYFFLLIKDFPVLLLPTSFRNNNHTNNTFILAKTMC